VLRYVDEANLSNAMKWLVRGSIPIAAILVPAAARKFRTEFEALDLRLTKQPYLLGDALSVLDIAWFIYANRLALAGYPIARLHPRLGAWLDALAERPEFAKEVAMPPEAKARIAATPRAHAQAGKSLEMVAGF
jgi:glutathione S-transferase